MNGWCVRRGSVTWPGRRCCAAIQSFLEIVDEVIEEGIATLQDVNIHFYRSGREPSTGGGYRGT